MNHPKNSYYTGEDYPTKREKESMWRHVEEQIIHPENGTLTLHWKSFWIGQAAAVLLILAATGLYFVIGSGAGDGEMTSQPPESVEQVYRSSLMELANASPITSGERTAEEEQAAESLVRGLHEIDKIIEEIRTDMLLNGSTEAKRSQLRRLYATKLDFVQQLILTEEKSS